MCFVESISSEERDRQEQIDEAFNELICELNGEFGGIDAAFVAMGHINRRRAENGDLPFTPSVIHGAVAKKVAEASKSR